MIPQPAFQIEPESERRRRPEHSVYWISAGVLLTASAALRFLFLGRDGFWSGELFHVFAAKSLLENGTLTVPMWGLYHEARPITLAVAAAFRVFGESEWAARAPFALLSAVFLALSFSIIRRLFSNSIALIYLAIVGLAPLCVEYAREVRMFAVHQMYFFIAATAFLIGFENLWRSPQGSEERTSGMDLRWLGVSALFSVAAWLLHPLTVLLAIPVAAYLLAMFGILWHRAGVRAALLSKYAAGLLVFALLSAALVRILPARLESLVRESSRIYDWQVQMGLGSGFYRHLLVQDYPALTFILPVGVFAALRQHGRRGLFMSVVFIPLLVTLSYVVARKSERYLMVIFPFFAVLAACAIAPLCVWAKTEFLRHFGGRPVRQKVIALAFFSPCALLFVHPWLESSLALPFRSGSADWKSIDREFKVVASHGVVITSNPREFLYYFHRAPDFYRTVEENGAVYEPGLVRDSQEFHDIVMAHDDIYFIGSEWNVSNDAFMTSDMRNTVNYSMSPVDHGGDHRILAFHRD